VAKGGTVLFDALRPESAPLLEAAGLKPLRHLKRMTLPAVRDTLSGVQAYAGAGFEWG